MQIVCSSCSKVLGIQEPFKDDTEVSAICPECFQKEIEEASRNHPLPKPGKRVDIILAKGIKGFLTVADSKSPKLYLWDLIVAGKKILCAGDKRESFLKFLEGIDSDEVELTFLYSSCIMIPPGGRRRKKHAAEEEKIKSNSIDYNCTVRVPRHYALMMFHDKAQKHEQFFDMIARTLVKEWKDERQGVS